MGCLFCEVPETGEYKPPKGIEYVCSDCTQHFINMSQDTLKDGIKFLENNKETLCVFNFEIIENKIKAINMFVGEDYEQRKPVSKNHRRNIDRKRIVRAVGNKEKRIGRSKVSA